jgi:glycyl-tRNA synthetase
MTVDVDTLTDQSVTIRDRDTMQQERLPIERVADRLHEKLRLNSK